MYDNEQGFFSPEHTEHLMDVTEIAEPMQELEELQQVMQHLSGKAIRRVEKVKKHMNQCGTCLSTMIAAGQLITLEEHWAMGAMTGQGRLPKLHRMLN